MRKESLPLQNNNKKRVNDCLFIAALTHSPITSAVFKWMMKTVRGRKVVVVGGGGIQTSRPTHALHCWSQGLLAASGSVPASSSWHRGLSVPGNTDSHIRLHLHNPAVDWSQFNGGWQSISITMFHPSTRQHQHRSVMTSGDARAHSLQ